MTYNQVIKRIETICLAHKQVKSFFKGSADDFLADKTRIYPGVLLEENEAAGGITFNGRNVMFGFTMSFADLVHVAADSRQNEQDVQSDMISVAMDIFAQLNYPSFEDWSISKDNSMKLFVLTGGDMYAGCQVDFTISIDYKQNVCEIPSTFFNYTPTSGSRVRITLDKDIVTGSWTILLTQIPDENNVPTDQDVTITDFTKGIVMKGPGGETIRMTFFLESNGDPSFKLTEI